MTAKEAIEIGMQIADKLDIGLQEMANIHRTRRRPMLGRVALLTEQRETP